MRIETARLLLCPWELADFAAFQPIATDPEVMRYITGGRPWSDEEVRSFLYRQIQLYDQRGFCRWKLTERASGLCAGFCGAGFWRDQPRPEIGWWLRRDLWGQGLATEAARAALADLFRRVGLERIMSVARPENAASIRVMRKLGLRFQGEFEAEGFRLVEYGMERAQFYPDDIDGPNITRIK